MKKKQSKKQIPVIVVFRGDKRYGHHSVHECSMTRQLGRPIKSNRSDEDTGRVSGTDNV